MAETKSKKKRTNREIEQLLIKRNRKAISEIKETIEANIVGCLWKDLTLYDNYKIESEQFGDSDISNGWKVMFIIGRELRAQKKKKLSVVEVELYLDQHPKMRDIYTEVGGIEIVLELQKFIEIANIDGYIADFYKWWSISKMNNKGWVKEEELKLFKDYTIDDVYTYYNAPFHDTFIHSSSSTVKSYNLCDDLDTLIEDADAGLIRGIPLHNASMLDNMIGGLRLGEITMLGAESGVGKEQPVSEPVLTNRGWKPIGDMKVGDRIYTQDGTLTTITGVFPQGYKDVYNVTFSDKTSSRCGLEHLWKVRTPNQQSRFDKDERDRYDIKSLKDIMVDYKNKRVVKSGDVSYPRKYYIPTCEPVRFRGKKVDIKPYTLGTILGGDHFQRRESELKKNNVEDNLYEKLIDLYKITDLYDDDIGINYIPRIYLHNSIKSRKSLLVGLFESNEGVLRNRYFNSKKNGTITFRTFSKKLHNDVMELGRSLGFIVMEKEGSKDSKAFNDKYDKGEEYLSRFIGDFKWLGMSDERLSRVGERKTNYSKKIDNIELVGKEEQVCIMVDHPSHLYITRDYIVTHNTTIMIELLFPTIFDLNEQIVVVLNEQDEKKMRREMLTWIANNIFEGDFNKRRWVQGSFTDDEKELLKKSAAWLQEKKDNKNIIIIPLERYSADLVVKIINKYSSMGVKYFALDTFKPSTDADINKQWQEMTRDSVIIFDAIKPAANNVSMFINLQLVKTNHDVPFLGLGSIGIAKNVVDVASTFIAVRKLWQTERSEGRNKREYIVNNKKEGSKTIIRKNIDSDNHTNHHVFFVPKAREGGGDYQILARNDLGKNTIKELGRMYIEE